MDEKTENKDKPAKKSSSTGKSSDSTKKSYNRKGFIKKEQVQEILDKLQSGKKIDTIVNEYKVSKGSLQKMLNIIRNAQWREKQEGDNLPKGMMFPVSVSEIVDAYMWDIGYVKDE